MNKREMMETLRELSEFSINSLIKLQFDETSVEDIVEEWEDKNFSFYASPDEANFPVDKEDPDADLWEEVRD